MDVLNEFKRKAEKLLQDQEQSGQSDSGIHHIRCMKTVSALQEIHNYLHELTELLNDLNNEVMVSMDLPPIGRLEQLQQNQYRLFAESAFHKEIVRLVFALQSDNTLELELPDTDDTSKQLDNFKRHGLIVSYLSRSPIKISIHGYIPVGIEFYSDFAESSIHVLLQNFNTLSDRYYLLNSDNVNEEFLNELGSFLLRRKNRFLEILVENTSNISGTFRSGQFNVSNQAPQTEEMEASRLRSLFNREQRLFLTYRNNIRDINARTATFVMGRAADCDMIVESDLASRHHAMIVFRKGKFVLVDQSTNGTFVKPQGAKEIYVQTEEVPLSGTGFISLGKSVTVDNENLIYYSCQ